MVNDNVPLLSKAKIMREAIRIAAGGTSKKPMSPEQAMQLMFKVRELLDKPIK